MDRQKLKLIYFTIGYYLRLTGDYKEYPFKNIQNDGNKYVPFNQCLALPYKI